jgi:hypothetical protein
MMEAAMSEEVVIKQAISTRFKELSQETIVTTQDDIPLELLSEAGPMVNVVKVHADEETIIHSYESK